MKHAKHAKKPTRVSYRTTGLASGYERAEKEGVGISPGAHPEFERGTKIGNPLKQIPAAIAKAAKALKPKKPRKP